MKIGIAGAIRGGSGELDTKLQKARKSLLLFARNPLSLIGLFVLLFFLGVTLLAPWLAPRDPLQLNHKAILISPGRQFILGTDEFGRDILSRVIYGARPSLGVALVVVIIALGIGVPVGALSGYIGKRVDEVVMRVADIFLAFPAFILAMAIAAALGPSLTSSMFAMAIVRWPVYARLIRGQTLMLKEMDFVTAAHCLGGRPSRVLRVHILPSCAPILIVQATLDMGWVVIATAGLSFVGFGAQPPLAEWGSMISNGRRFVTSAWWYTVFPGLALLLCAMGFNLLGDALMEILDPRLRSEFYGRT